MILIDKLIPVDVKHIKSRTQLYAIWIHHVAIMYNTRKWRNNREHMFCNKRHLMLSFSPYHSYPIGLNEEKISLYASGILCINKSSYPSSYVSTSFELKQQLCNTRFGEGTYMLASWPFGECWTFHSIALGKITLSL